MCGYGREREREREEREREREREWFREYVRYSMCMACMRTKRLTDQPQ
jgi:hypothetical protein